MMASIFMCSKVEIVQLEKNANNILCDIRQSHDRDNSQQDIPATQYTTSSQAIQVIQWDNGEVDDDIEVASVEEDVSVPPQASNRDYTRDTITKNKANK